MINNNADFEYQTRYKGKFETTKYCTNDTVTLKYGTKQIGII